MSEGAFQITWSPTARRALAKLPEKVGTAAIEFLCGPLARNPHRVGKALRFELEGVHTARRGDFRIVYLIADSVTIIAIEHRADVYRPPLNGSATSQFSRHQRATPDWRRNDAAKRARSCFEGVALR